MEGVAMHVAAALILDCDAGQVIDDHILLDGIKLTDNISRQCANQCVQKVAVVHAEGTQVLEMGGVTSYRRADACNESHYCKDRDLLTCRIVARLGRK